MGISQKHSTFTKCNQTYLQTAPGLERRALPSIPSSRTVLTHTRSWQQVQGPRRAAPFTTPLLTTNVCHFQHQAPPAQTGQGDQASCCFRLLALNKRDGLRSPLPRALPRGDCFISITNRKPFTEIRQNCSQRGKKVALDAKTTTVQTGPGLLFPTLVQILEAKTSHLIM